MANNKMNVEGKNYSVFRCGVDIHLPLKKLQDIIISAKEN